MARIRSIHPNACTSDKLAAVSSDAERLYWRLQTYCDDEGRCEDNPRLIWGACAISIRSWDEDRVDIILEELNRHGLIVRYRVDGRRYLAVLEFSTYQHPKRPTASKLPEPPSPAVTPTVDEHSPAPHPHVSPGVGGEMEVEGRGENTSSPQAATAPSPPLPIAQSDFDAFWKLYPRKVGKGDARKAWKRAVGRLGGSDVRVFEALAVQMPAWALHQPQFTPHPATWLNRDGWEDEPVPPPAPTGGRQRIERGHSAIANVVGAAAAAGLTTPELEP